MYRPALCVAAVLLACGCAHAAVPRRLLGDAIELAAGLPAHGELAQASSLRTSRLLLVDADESDLSKMRSWAHEGRGHDPFRDETVDERRLPGDDTTVLQHHSSAEPAARSDATTAEVSTPADGDELTTLQEGTSAGAAVDPAKLALLDQPTQDAAGDDAASEAAVQATTSLDVGPVDAASDASSAAEQTSAASDERAAVSGAAGVEAGTNDPAEADSANSAGTAPTAEADRDAAADPAASGRADVANEPFADGIGESGAAAASDAADPSNGVLNQPDELTALEAGVNPELSRAEADVVVKAPADAPVDGAAEPGPEVQPTAEPGAAASAATGDGASAERESQVREALDDVAASGADVAVNPAEGTALPGSLAGGDEGTSSILEALESQAAGVDGSGGAPEAAHSAGLDGADPRGGAQAPTGDEMGLVPGADIPAADALHQESALDAVPGKGGAGSSDAALLPGSSDVSADAESGAAGAAAPAGSDAESAASEGGAAPAGDLSAPETTAANGLALSDALHKGSSDTAVSVNSSLPAAEQFEAAPTEDVASTGALTGLDANALDDASPGTADQPTVYSEADAARDSADDQLGGAVDAGVDTTTLVAPSGDSSVPLSGFEQPGESGGQDPAEADDAGAQDASLNDGAATDDVATGNADEAARAEPELGDDAARDAAAAGVAATDSDSTTSASPAALDAVHAPAQATTPSEDPSVSLATTGMELDVLHAGTDDFEERRAEMDPLAADAATTGLDGGAAQQPSAEETREQPAAEERTVDVAADASLEDVASQLLSDTEPDKPTYEQRLNDQPGGEEQRAADAVEPEAGSALPGAGADASLQEGDPPSRAADSLELLVRKEDELQEQLAVADDSAPAARFDEWPAAAEDFGGDRPLATGAFDQDEDRFGGDALSSQHPRHADVAAKGGEPVDLSVSASEPTEQAAAPPRPVAEAALDAAPRSFLANAAYVLLALLMGCALCAALAFQNSWTRALEARLDSSNPPAPPTAAPRVGEPWGPEVRLPVAPPRKPQWNSPSDDWAVDESAWEKLPLQR